MGKERKLSEPAALEVMAIYEDHIQYDSARETLKVTALAGASEPHLIGKALNALSGQKGYSYDGGGVRENAGTVTITDALAVAVAEKLVAHDINFKGRGGVPDKAAKEA